MAMEWIFLTASFGGENFHEAALRLIDQSKQIREFSKRIYVNEENLEEFAPKTKNQYSDLLNSSVPGFGYFSWKPEIVNTVLNRYPECGVAYVDAGCELNSSFLAKVRLKQFLKKAKNGSYFHTLNYQEQMYTKKLVLDYFDLSDTDRRSPQIQATWFLISGQLGKEISNRWLSAALKGREMLDDSSDLESLEFKGHRHDQSLLSCAAKSMQIQPKRHKPCFRPLTLASRIQCNLHPIWSSRNRSGQSIQRTVKG